MSLVLALLLAVSMEAVHLSGGTGKAEARPADALEVAGTGRTPEKPVMTAGASPGRSPGNAGPDGSAPRRPTPGFRLPELPEGPGTQGSAQAAFETPLTGFPQDHRSLQLMGRTLRLGDSGDTRGMALDSALLPREPRRLVIQGTYLGATGEGDPAGAAAASAGAWDLALDTRLLQQRLHLRAELAQSWQSPLQGPGPTLTRTGQAYGLEAGYGRAWSLPFGGPLDWTLRLRRRSLDQSFWSLDDQSAYRGRCTDTLSTAFGWGPLGLNLTHQRALGITPGTPDRLESDAANLRYAASAGAQSSWLDDTLGVPSYTLTVRQERARDAASLPPGRYTRLAQATARFSRDRLWWQVSQTRSLSRTPGEGAPEAVKDLTNLALELRIGTLLVQPALEWSAEAKGAPVVRRLAGTLSGSATLIPDRLDTSLNLTASRLYSPDTSLDQRDLHLESRFAWNIRRPHPNRAAVTVSLTGSYEYREDAGPSAAGQSYSEYQALAGIEVAWDHTD